MADGEFDYDLFVIGAGSGGVRASRVAAAYGAKVAVAEEYRVGGTCVIRGCVPKKMLVYGAHFAEDLEDAQAFGWTIDAPKFDWKVLRDNVLKELSINPDIEFVNDLGIVGVKTVYIDNVDFRFQTSGDHLSNVFQVFRDLVIGIIHR